MKLKDYAKIGKALIKTCVIPSEKVKQTKTVQSVDVSVCCSNQCPIYKQTLKQANPLTCLGKNIDKMHSEVSEALQVKCCSAGDASCPYGAIVSSEKEFYDYELLHSKRGDVSKFSKVQIKLILVYHFMADRFGFALNVNQKELAEKIGCDVKTIRIANEELWKKGLIETLYLGNFIQNVLVLDCKNYHKDKNAGGSGYLVMSVDTLDQLLACDQLAKLQLMFRMLLSDDGNNMYIDNNQNPESPKKRRTSKLKIQSILNFLPSYISKKGFEQMVEAVQNLFTVKLEGECLLFELLPRYNGKQVKKTYIKEQINELKRTCQTLGFELANVDYEDLANMSLEYGEKLVQEGLSAIENTVNNQLEKVSFAIKGILDTYNDKPELSSQEEIFYSELVAVTSGEKCVTELSPELVRQHPKLKVQGLSYIENFGGYLRSIVRSILKKQRLALECTYVV